MVAQSVHKLDWVFGSRQPFVVISLWMGRRQKSPKKAAADQWLFAPLAYAYKRSCIPEGVSQSWLTPAVHLASCIVVSCASWPSCACRLVAPVVWPGLWA